MKKLVSIVLVLAMCLSLGVIAGAAENEVAGYTFTATNNERNGISTSATPVWHTVDVAPGTYLLTANIATNGSNAPTRIDVYHADASSRNFAANTRIAKSVVAHTPAWGTFKDFTLCLVEITEDKKYIAIDINTNMARLASITLTPVTGTTYTYENTGSVYNGMGVGNGVWFEINVPAGRYAVMLEGGVNTVGGKFDCYLAKQKNTNTDLITVGTDVHINYPKWSTGNSPDFSHVNLGYSYVSEDYKAVAVNFMGESYGQIKSITLIPVPTSVESVRPDINVFVGNSEISTLPDGTTGEMTVRVNVNTATDTKTYLPIVAYYEGDKMMDAKVAVVGKYANEYDAVLTNVTKGADNCIKVFLWDGLDTIMPYGKPTEIK